MTKTLAVVGAGPKAVAVAAKAAALRDMGVGDIDVIAVERAGVAANWRAVGGWTDGRQRLGTNPEKDIGFPYRSVLVPGRNAELDERMVRLSWQSYLVATGRFAGWVDRGRPSPSHDTWAGYLRWVAEAVELKVVRGEVVRLALDGPKWAVHTSDSRVSADAVMITGPGLPGRSILPGHPRVLSIAQFWQRAAGPSRIVAGRVAVIGGGESAASILNEVFHHRFSAITVISPQATLFTRGEGFFENLMFSDPTEWQNLTQAERRNAIARTDRGVISARVQESILADERIRHLRGRVAAAVDCDDRVRIMVHTDRPPVAHDGRNGERLETVHDFDLVIDGSGVDPLAFLSLLDPDAARTLSAGL
ncbi:MAG TPA: SidA/IucD/PvdA family monooxygenase, partial [Mycobacterium sp.]|nr:SidA/IucD/PvdA family monooxygenase [Mycobacterium sp.]